MYKSAKPSPSPQNELKVLFIIHLFTDHKCDTCQCAIPISPDNGSKFKSLDFKTKLEDLKRSPDLLNNVIIGQGQLIIQTYFVLPHMGAAILIK